MDRVRLGDYLPQAVYLPAEVYAVSESLPGSLDGLFQDIVDAEALVMRGLQARIEKQVIYYLVALEDLLVYVGEVTVQVWVFRLPSYVNSGQAYGGERVAQFVRHGGRQHPYIRQAFRALQLCPDRHKPFFRSSLVRDIL